MRVINQNRQLPDTNPLYMCDHDENNEQVWIRDGQYSTRHSSSQNLLINWYDMENITCLHIKKQSLMFRS